MESRGLRQVSECNVPTKEWALKRVRPGPTVQPACAMGEKQNAARNTDVTLEGTGPNRFRLPCDLSVSRAADLGHYGGGANGASRREIPGNGTHHGGRSFRATRSGCLARLPLCKPDLSAGRNDQLLDRSEHRQGLCPRPAICKMDLRKRTMGPIGSPSIRSRRLLWRLRAIPGKVGTRFPSGIA